MYTYHYTYTVNTFLVIIDVHSTTEWIKLKFYPFSMRWHILSKTLLALYDCDLCDSWRQSYVLTPWVKSGYGGPEVPSGDCVWRPCAEACHASVPHRPGSSPSATAEEIATGRTSAAQNTRMETTNVGQRLLLMTRFGILAYPHERPQRSDFARLLLGLQEPITTGWSNFPIMLWECFHNGGLLSQVVLNFRVHRPPQCCVDQCLHQHLRDMEIQIQFVT